jgi:hypothetical protein
VDYSTAGRNGESRYAALHAVLKQCRLHPVDTTPAAEIVIVEETALRAHLEDVQATIGAGDTLHLVTASGERLVIEVIAAPGGLADSPPELVSWRRPVWLKN